MPQLPGDSSAVGCSKVFQQLARLAGARPQREGLHVPRTLRLEDLTKWIPRLARLPAHRRAELPGISPHRARQSLAGAVLAETLMRVTGHDVVTICPWSTKEGLLITLLDCAPDAGVKTSRAS
jgi:exopolyphosphatase/guanosine-5'-triphosphate,3'-diphosphate pyrophosphatase